MEKIVIVGTGGLAREFTQFFSSTYNIIGYMSVKEKEHKDFFLPGKIFRDDKSWDQIGTNLAVLAVSSSILKEELFYKLKESGFVFPTIVHKSSIISSNTRFEEGVIISPQCVIGSNVKISRGSFINFSCGVGHDTEIGSFVQVNPGAQIGGFTKISDKVLVGSGSIIRQGIKIGKNSVIGSGSDVLRKVNENLTVIGNPAKLYNFHNIFDNNADIKENKQNDFKTKSKNHIKILFFGREECQYTVSAFNLLKQLNFNVKFIKSKVLGESIPEEALQWRGDYIICFRSFYIITKELLQRANIASINFHPGPTQYPGSGCINFALYEEAKEYGVTAHIMNEKIDNGKIIECRRFPIFKEDNVDTLLKRTHKKLLELFVDVVKGIKNGNDKFIGKKLIEAKKEKWNGLARKMNELNKLQSIPKNVDQEELKRVIRATYTDNHPTKTIIHGHEFILKK